MRRALEQTFVDAPRFRKRADQHHQPNIHPAAAIRSGKAPNEFFRESMKYVSAARDTAFFTCKAASYPLAAASETS
jgi:hypothetical protein